MPNLNILQRVSQAPTNPQPKATPKVFDVADLYRGPAASEPSATDASLPLDERLWQAYFWIVNHAIISPRYPRVEYRTALAHAADKRRGAVKLA